MKPVSGLFFGSLALAMLLSGCAPKEPGGNESEPSSSKDGDLKISIDGSSTVYPIAQAMSEGFNRDDIKMSVSESGTGSGFKKFTAGEIDIATASRPIEKEEIELAKKNNVEFVEIPIAYDGLTVVVNKDNAAISDITMAELKKLWEPDSKVMTWADLRAGLPADKISLFGPGDKSGTFDYFTEVVCGKKRASRSDYQPSEDDNVLVKGVGGEKNALGYFGFSYYFQNKDTLKALKVDGVEPTMASILDGTYGKLARPLFLYVSKKSMERQEVKDFVAYGLKELRKSVEEAEYIPLTDNIVEKVKARVEAGTTGSIFSEAAPGSKLMDVLSKA